MKRNYALDFIKILFSVSIACGHFKTSILPSGMVVEVFFILSGFFLVQSFYSGKYHDDPCAYTANRLKRIYPYYLSAFVVLFLAFNAQDLIHPFRFLSSLTQSVPEMLLVQNIGIFDGGINYPLWQLCTLIIASHILFSLMVWDSQLTLNALCPVAAICVFTYFSNAFGSHSVEYWGVIGNFLSAPLLRAFGSLCLGMTAYRPVSALASFIRTRLSVPVSFVLSTFLVLLFWIARSSYAAHLLFLLFLPFCLAGKGISSLFDRSCFACGEKLSLSVYLNQASLIYLLNTTQLLARFSDTVQLLLFIPLLILYSLLFFFVVDHLISWCSAHFLQKDASIGS